LASNQNSGNERKYGFAERKASCSVMHKWAAPGGQIRTGAFLIGMEV